MISKAVVTSSGSSPDESPARVEVSAPHIERGRAADFGRLYDEDFVAMHEIIIWHDAGRIRLRLSTCEMEQLQVAVTQALLEGCTKLEQARTPDAITRD